MNQEKLKQIAFAAGWVEGRLQEDLEAVTGAEEKDEEEIKHRKEMLEAFMILSNGFDDLRRQNADYEIKLMMVRGAIQI